MKLGTDSSICHIVFFGFPELVRVHSMPKILCRSTGYSLDSRLLFDGSCCFVGLVNVRIHFWAQANDFDYRRSFRFAVEHSKYHFVFLVAIWMASWIIRIIEIPVSVLVLEKELFQIVHLNGIVQGIGIRENESIVWKPIQEEIIMEPK